MAEPIGLLGAVGVIAANAAQVGQEFCPDCGEFVDELNEQTGFCYNCTQSAHSSTPVVSRLEKWLCKYADTIEEEMRSCDIGAIEAIANVLSSHQATCMICDRIIKHGTFGRHFICSSTPQCKKARRR